ncbi:DUF3558 domain-containing protein [Nocardia farcinica]|uniref:DUF3558 domain-containing protein n=1 Tax=Nocardia farcinica TaxID=37329 RepID=UPI002457585D|nr:DUF3558 domain-containing protein [Nocardia farcinica]
MRIAVVLRAIVAAVGVVGVVGCGTTVDGAATTSTVSAPADVYDPCAQLSDSALREAGLDPASESVTTNADGPASWRICGWYPADHRYKVDVLSTSHTIAETRANEKLNILREVTVGGRRGLVTQDKSDRQGNSCYVALPAQQGMFEIAIGWESSAATKPDLCALAVEYAHKLEPHLPG